MKKVLIIEDGADPIEFVGFILQNEGYHVKTNRVLFLSEIAAINAILISLDHWLTQWLRNKLFAELKFHPQTKHIPMNLYSSNKFSGKFPEDWTAEGYLTKPFDIDSFLGAVNRLSY